MTELTLADAKVIISALTRAIESNARKISELENQLGRRGMGANNPRHGPDGKFVKKEIRK